MIYVSVSNTQLFVRLVIDMIIKITVETGDVSNSREIINHNPLLCMPPRPSQNNCQRNLVEKQTLV